MALPPTQRGSVADVDEERMREVYAFTARTLETPVPVPFGALIVNTRTGERLMRATNAVRRENDPSSHAETRAVRLACKKLKRPHLEGYTMYSTCEPCPMCMANALWARLDRVVYGATIADANRHCLQIHIDAKEVVRRSDMHCIVDGPSCANFATACSPIPTCRRPFAPGPAQKTIPKKRPGPEESAHGPAPHRRARFRLRATNRAFSPSRRSSSSFPATSTGIRPCSASSWTARSPTSSFSRWAQLKFRACCATATPRIFPSPRAARAPAIMARRFRCTAAWCSISRAWIRSKNSSRMASPSASPACAWACSKAKRAKVGWELRCYPSTVVKASVGGFLGGGSGGIGSVAHGGLRDFETVRALEVVTMEPEPRVVQHKGEAVHEILHAWGTNGIITRIWLALAPAVEWSQCAVAFDTFDAAFDFSERIATGAEWTKRLVTTFEWPIPSFLHARETVRARGQGADFFSDRVRVSLPRFEAAARAAGGEVTYSGAYLGLRSRPLLSDYTWNHTTLWAMKADDAYTYLQCGFDPDTVRDSCAGSRRGSARRFCFTWSS